MTEESKINFAKIEKKWQKKWEENKVFEVSDKSKKPKFYVLEMFPYPSGSGLHMGHALNYTIGDIFARFKRMNGFNVLYPMGYDALGLPAENAAIKDKTHPEDYTKKSMKNFMKQQKMLGLSYDWSRLMNTSSPDYYKWDQWIFLKMFEKGLAYQKTASVNWCPSCKTVLANEQAQTGNCERCGSKVEIKNLKQWFLKITDYADELLDKIDDLDWPARTKAMQKNWIGKSYGTEIDFEIETPKRKIIEKNKQKFFDKCVDELNGFFEINWKKNLPELIIMKSEKEANELFKEQFGIEREWPIGWIRGAEKVCVLDKKFCKQINSDEEYLELIKHELIHSFTFVYCNRKGFSCQKLPKWLWEGIAIYLSGQKLNKDRELKNFLQSYDSHAKGLYEESGNAVGILLENFGKDKLFELISGCKNIKNEKEFYGFFEKVYGFKAEYKKFNELPIRKKFPIFTTRPDTVFGVTFMVISAQHQKLMDLVTADQKPEVEKFLKKLKSVSEKDMADLEKEGVFTGSYAINPVTKDKVPIYAGNFVVADYGSGMVMAVPAHDARDFAFAKKYEIPIKVVIDPIGQEIEKPEKMTSAYISSGNLINSGEFDGIENSEAKEKITAFLEKKKIGRKKVNFKLRDWLISRQRYWGTPIPVVYCEKCGSQPIPVKEKDLPVKLPKEVKFGEGNPLETNERWIKTKCPKCGGEARRETDTMDTFVNSSWYFLRYCDPNNSKKIFDEKKVDYWCPIDQYIGGAEHACMHLIYFRFYTKFLRDLGLLDFDEPAKRLFHQGMLHGEDGEKMSKSRGNVVLPEVVSDKYGIDTARMFLISVASPDNDIDWSEKGIEGSSKFVKKLFDFFDKVKISKKSNPKIESKLNKIIKEVANQIENFKYNLAIIKVRELFSTLFKEKEVSKEVLEKSLKLLHPICPHITEELFEKLGNSDFISLSEWPKVEEKKIDDKFDKQEEAFEKLVGDILNIGKILEEKGAGSEGKKVYVYVIPNEKEFYSDDEISRRVGKEVKIFAVNDKGKYDPENKSKKSKPGKPAIYFE